MYVAPFVFQDPFDCGAKPVELKLLPPEVYS